MDILKSKRLDHLKYEIRGPVYDKALSLQNQGYKITSLNIGNPAAFGFETPDEIVHDIIVNIRNAQGYVDSRGLFAARKAVMQYYQNLGVKNILIEDIYIGNGVSELISLVMTALLNTDDEVLIPSPDYIYLLKLENGYNHLYRLHFDGTQQQITTGKWDVMDLYGIDAKNEFIYYSSAENGAITKCIYKIKADGNGKTLISGPAGYNEADFTTGMNYFVKYHSTANSPALISLCDNSGKMIRVLENNEALNTKLAGLNLGEKEFMTFNMGDYSLNAWMIKPANFDPSKKYPVYMVVYGGPGHNEVIDSWGGANYMYHQLLAQKGYIVVSVDPRGTMYRGAEFKKSTYLQLGKLETEDLILTGKQLQKLPFVDADRIGIQGWSYGGFMSSLAITKGADVYKMAIAVAPVTNWKFYDNIYTERFMRTPKENESGYNDNSPTNFAHLLKGKYLLIHGSGDDNVHYQNALEMVNALVKADKQFDMFIYPNRNHGIYGGNTRNHLYNMMLNYTLNNL